MVWGTGVKFELYTLTAKYSLGRIWIAFKKMIFLVMYLEVQKKVAFGYFLF